VGVNLGKWGVKMKVLKIISIAVFSLVIAIYLAFLFILPNAIDLNKYSPQLAKAIQDSTGVQVHISGLKVKTAWNLTAGAFVDKTDLNYPTGKKFAQINGLQVRLSLLPMFLGVVKVEKIDLDKILLNVDIKKDGKFLIEDYIPKSQSQARKPIKFSEKMPNILVKKYRVSFVDIASSKTYSIKGSNLNISNFILNKKIKVKTQGELILNDRKQITYNLSLFSKIPLAASSKKEYINIIKIFEDLYKYNVQSTITVNLKMSGIAEEPKIDGKINLDKISFVFGGKPFPPSTLGLDLQGDRIRINSNLYTDTNSKAVISGVFKHGKHEYIDLRVVSSQTSLSNLVLIANTALKTFGKKDLQDISASGILQADFNIKSDFKKIQSSGFLKIQNAAVTHKLYNVALNSISADIDFSQDSIRIKQATASLNSQPITIKGTIDKKANADISVIANNLQLKGLLLTSGNSKLLKDNDVQGLVNIKVALKGHLDKAKPSIDVLVNNIILRNKPTKTKIKISKIVANINSNDKNNGKAEIVGLSVYPNSPATISAPKLNISFNEKELDIEKTFLYINGIKTNLSGRISGLNSTPRLNSVYVSVPNQVSVPITGYPGSNMILKGDLTISGALERPDLKGSFSVPMVRIPTIGTTLKNTTLIFDKDIKLNCTQMQISNSFMGFNASINKDFSKGVVVQNIDFASSNLDLDTLGASMANIPKGSSSELGITVLGGKTAINRFKVGNIVANNITSELALRQNVLMLNDLLGDAYFGKIKGNVSYDLINGKAKINIGGRGLSAGPTLKALSGTSNGIVGQLDFDSNISLRGSSARAILKSLNGNTDFVIHNGSMGLLGKFEHLLYAQNIISNSFFNATLNVIAKAVSIKNTGVYKYMKGKVSFSNGWADIHWIKTSGPSMSLYLTGRYYLPGNTAHLTILGRISDDVVRVLGPIGEFSMDKAIASIPKIGAITAALIGQYTTNPNYENTDLIPDLSPKTGLQTKDFKVVIDGDVQKQNSVKSFKWISKPKVVQPQGDQYPTPYTPVQKQLPTSIPDFVNKLPDLLN